MTSATLIFAALIFALVLMLSLALLAVGYPTLGVNAWPSSALPAQTWTPRATFGNVPRPVCCRPCCGWPLGQRSCRVVKTVRPQHCGCVLGMRAGARLWHCTFISPAKR